MIAAPTFKYVPPAEPADDKPLPTHVQDLIVGSGAAASVIASHLAKAGRNVALIEEGPARDSGTYAKYTHADVLAQMYRSGGGFPVIGGPGTPPIILIMARCKGGGTVINGAVCYRTTAEVIEGWRDDLSLSHLTREIWGAYERVEQRIGVTSMSDMHSRAALKVREGARKLGWASHDVHRNTPGCRGSSRCMFGCVEDHKQSMLVTYLQEAEQHGATVYSDARVTKIEGNGGRVTGVRGKRDGVPFHITAERVFLACGAVFTPFLMMKSGINHLRAIGRHLTIHPSTRAYYVWNEAVKPWEGAFQSFAVHQFRDEGIHIINLFPPPFAFAASFPAIGADLRRLMDNLDHTSIMGALISDRSEGRVFAAPLIDAPIVRYTMTPPDYTLFKRVIGLLGELAFASGVREVYLPFNWRPPVHNLDELRAQLASKVAPHDFEITAQHPLGTCRMGYDEDLSVVREDGRVHGFDNLYVVDSSVVPTSIGVNPMLTILAVADVIGQSLTS